MKFNLPISYSIIRSKHNRYGYVDFMLHMGYVYNEQESKKILLSWEPWSHNPSILYLEQCWEDSSEKITKRMLLSAAAQEEFLKVDLTASDAAHKIIEIWITSQLFK